MKVAIYCRLSEEDRNKVNKEGLDRTHRSWKTRSHYRSCPGFYSLVLLVYGSI